MKTLYTVFLISALAMAGCTDNSNSEQPKNIDTEREDENIVFDVDTFNRERAAWEAQGIGDYSFEAKETNDVTGIIQGLVTVEENSVTNYIILYGDKRDRVPDYYYNFPMTISDLYDWLFSKYEGAPLLLEELGEGYYVSFSIYYDEQYHYPESAGMGFSHREKGTPAGGGVFSFKLSNFQITE